MTELEWKVEPRARMSASPRGYAMSHAAMKLKEVGSDYDSEEDEDDHDEVRRCRKATNEKSRNVFETIRDFRVDDCRRPPSRTSEPRDDARPIPSFSSGTCLYGQPRLGRPTRRRGRRRGPLGQ